MVQLQFYEAMRKLFVLKDNKNNKIVYSTISSLLCQSPPHVHESITTHACDAADAGVSTLFLKHLSRASITKCFTSKIKKKQLRNNNKKRSRCSDVEHPSLRVHFLYILVQINKAGQKQLQVILAVEIFRYVYEDCCTACIFCL